MTRIDKTTTLVYPKLSYKIYGACFKVHNKLGSYLNEQQYCDGLEEELKNMHINYFREFYIKPHFEGENKNRNRVDFLIDDKIIIEVKAQRLIQKSAYYQVKRYLQSSDKKLGIIVNFRNKYLRPKRILN